MYWGSKVYVFGIVSHSVFSLGSNCNGTYPMKATTLLPGAVWACLLQIANCLHKNKDHPGENKDITLAKMWRTVHSGTLGVNQEIVWNFWKSWERKGQDKLYLQIPSPRPFCNSTSRDFSSLIRFPIKKIFKYLHVKWEWKLIQSDTFL